MIIIENKNINIKSYENIILLESDVIEIKTKDRIIEIKGQNLTVNYYNQYELIVHGDYCSIVFK